MTIAVLAPPTPGGSNPTGAAKIDTNATTTAELLADRAAIERRRPGSDTVPVDSLALASPVTKPCRVVAQMTNSPPTSRTPDGSQNDPVDVLP